jgi:ferric-dicitrate binding protein FerR (iron transport regulator)
MTGEKAEAGSTEFERRARALLLQSAEELPGALRSRLTQARHAALAARAARAPSFTRRWLPAGAAIAAVLALLVVYVPHGRGGAENPVANAGLEDIELLTDNDAVPLNGDQDVDYDFYEWAADEADGATAPAVGS